MVVSWLGTPLCIRHCCAGLTAHTQPSLVDRGLECGKVSHLVLPTVPDSAWRVPVWLKADLEPESTCLDLGPALQKGWPVITVIFSPLNRFECGFLQQEPTTQPGTSPPPARVTGMGVSRLSPTGKATDTRLLWSLSLPAPTRKTGWGSCPDGWLLTHPQPLPSTSLEGKSLL